MSESFLIEIWGEPAGYLLEEGSAFRFHALTRPFFTLDGAQFTKPGHARLAVNDRLAASRQPVDQRRLPHVRKPDDRDLWRPGAHEPASPRSPRWLSCRAAQHSILTPNSSGTDSVSRCCKATA